LKRILVAALALTACGQTTVGVAARVGDATIETSTVAGRVARTYENEVFAQRNPKDAFQRDLLSAMVRRELLREAGRREGISVSEADVTKEIDRRVEISGGRRQFELQAAASGVPVEDIRPAIHAFLLEVELGDHLVEDIVVTEEQLRAQYRKQLPTHDQAEIAHILLRDERRARTVARLAREPGADFAKLAARYSVDDESATNGGELGVIGNGGGRFAKEFEEAVFSAQTGDIVGPVRTVTQGDAKIVGYEIIKIIRRVTRTFEQVRDDVRRSIVGEEADKRVNALLAELAGELGVRINPRFGRWDGGQLAVVPDGDSLSTPSPEPGGNLPPGGPPGGVPPQ
jgi:parvulin-like peptidyl-prolyl isomerase